MAYLIQGLTLVSFFALCIFGLLAYFKDHKQYPMYPIGLKISIITTFLLVSLEIFLALPNIVGVFMWAFLASLVAVIYYIIQMIIAKTPAEKIKQRNFAIAAMVLAIIAMIAVGVLSVKLGQRSDTLALMLVNL